MPIGEYFQNHGEEVLGAMKKTYKDPKKAKAVFYATANKTKQLPKGAVDVLSGKAKGK